MFDMTHEFQKLRLASELEAMFEGHEFSLEDASGMVGFFGGIGDAIKGIFKKFVNVHESADMIAPVDGKQAIRLVKANGASIMKDLVVFRVPWCIQSGDKYAEIAAEHAKEFVDIVERLYKPADDWLAHVITDPDYAKRMWIDKELKFADLETMKRQYNLIFNTKDKDDDSSLVKFIHVYPSANSFEKCFPQLEKLSDSLSAVNMVKMKKVEESIIERIDKLMALIREEGEITLNEGNRKRLAQVFTAIARETEYMVALFFHANQAIAAWNQNVKKIEEVYG
jgi:hypothetical protein